MRTAGFQQPFGTAAGYGGASFATRQWMDVGTAAGIDVLSQQIAMQEQNLARNLKLTQAQQAQLNQALTALSAQRYEFGMEGTDWAASGAAQRIAADRLNVISTTLGRSIEELTEVMSMSAEQWAAAQQELRDALTETMTGIEGDIRDFARGLPEALGITQLEQFQRGLATSEFLAPMERLAGARSIYEEMRTRAFGGDIEAIRGFPEAAQTLLGIGREAFASGPDFQALFREVNLSLNQVLDKQREQQADLMSGLQISIVELRVAWIEELRTTKNALVKGLDDVRKELQRLEAA
jgi:hypothetical protein